MGQPKLLLPFGGEPLIGRVVTALARGRRRARDRGRRRRPTRPRARAVAEAAAQAGADGRSRRRAAAPRCGTRSSSASTELAPRRPAAGRPARRPATALASRRRSSPGARALGRIARRRSSSRPRGGRRGHPIVLPWDLARRDPDAARRHRDQCPGGASTPTASSSSTIADPELARRPRTRPKTSSAGASEDGHDRESRDAGHPCSDRPALRPGQAAGRQARDRGRAARCRRRSPTFALALAVQHPELAPLAPRVMIAVDAEYAPTTTVDRPRRRGRGDPAGQRRLRARHVASCRGPPMIEITEAPIDHAALTERVRSNQAGAVCTFLGTVRELTGDRQTVVARLRGLSRDGPEEDGRARGRGPAPLADHRAGARPPRRPPRPGRGQRRRRRELPHRDQAFEACRWLIDTLKEVVPIWKQEIWADGTEEWVHPGPGPPRDRRVGLPMCEPVDACTV